MTPKRQSELESLLRKLRQVCFESDKAERLIPVVKARLMPIWDAHHRETVARRTQNYMM